MTVRTGRYAATAAGELDAKSIQDTVKLLGDVAVKLWTAGKDHAKELLSDPSAASALAAEAAQEEETEPGDAFRSFEDLEMLESGFAREYISDECLSPCPSTRRWMTCNVIKEEKTMFRMYLEDSHTRFVLSAKRIGDSFYISQYEAFPETVEDVPECYYCAVLRTCSNGHFKLFLNGCEHCDKRTDKYTCGSARHTEDRQLLAEIHHSVRRIKAANADMRCLSVKLANVGDDKKTREVWCPRIAQQRRNASDSDKFEGMGLVNKLPEWNEDLQSLVLRFNKGRVLAPSAKNFLLCIENEENKEGVLQFGKMRRKRYALDFRYPMSPVQAFGVCLSLFNWTV